MFELVLLGWLHTRICCLNVQMQVEFSGNEQLIAQF